MSPSTVDDHADDHQIHQTTLDAVQTIHTMLGAASLQAQSRADGSKLMVDELNQKDQEMQQLRQQVEQLRGQTRILTQECSAAVQQCAGLQRQLDYSLHRHVHLALVFAAFDAEHSGGDIDAGEFMNMSRAQSFHGKWNLEMSQQLLHQLNSDSDRRMDSAEFVKHYDTALPDNVTKFDAIIHQYLNTAQTIREEKQSKAESVDNDLSLAVDVFVGTDSYN